MGVSSAVFQAQSTEGSAATFTAPDVRETVSDVAAINRLVQNGFVLTSSRRHTHHSCPIHGCSAGIAVSGCSPRCGACQDREGTQSVSRPSTHMKSRPLPRLGGHWTSYLYSRSLSSSSSHRPLKRRPKTRHPWSCCASRSVLSIDERLLIYFVRVTCSKRGATCSNVHPGAQQCSVTGLLPLQGHCIDPTELRNLTGSEPISTRPCKRTPPACHEAGNTLVDSVLIRALY